jgi:hypothetical protein
MSTTLPASSTVSRTPDDIAFELSSYRDSIRASIQSRAEDLRTAQSHQSSRQLAGTALLRTIGSAQQYLQTAIRTSVTPSAVVQFIARRPMLVGVMAAATAGVIAMVGPRRLFGWAAKAAAAWRIASAIRHN